MKIFKWTLFACSLGLALQPISAMAQISALSSQQQILVCHDFNSTLKLEQSGAEISLLQYFLQKEGFSIDPQELGQFSETTYIAVKAFQEKYRNDILVPADLTAGSGNFGPLTRAKLNSIYGCSVINKSTSVVPTLGMSNMLLDQNGVTSTFCNNSKFGIVTFPARIRLNGINRDFEVDGAHAAGSCVTSALPYQTWGLTYDQGTTFTAIGIIDPYGIYKKSSIVVPLTASTTLSVPAISGPHLSVRSIVLKSSGLQGTFCNLGTQTLSSFPVRISLNGVVHDFDVQGAYAAGKCQPMSWPYSTWSFAAAPGSSYSANVTVDPNNIYSESDEFDNSASVIGTI